MTLTNTEKELAAVAISVAAGCKPCTSYHLSAARKSSAREEEIREAVEVAARVRGGATEIMLCRGLGREEDGCTTREAAEPNRTHTLSAIGAAYAVNCTSSLKRHLEAATTLGISAGEIQEVVQLAVFIKKMAATHVEQIVAPEGGATTPPDSETRVAPGGCGCG
jgi:AhpD family alkylhydroperoxidase